MVNPVPGPEAIQLDERGSGPELATAKLLCHAALGSLNMPSVSVIRSGPFGMRSSMR